MQPCHCPNCNGRFNRAEDAIVGGEALEPAPGDLAVCQHCAFPLIVGDNGEIRKLTEADVNTLSPEACSLLSRMHEQARYAIAWRTMQN